MLSSITTMVGYGLAAVAIGWALYFWRRSGQLYTLLMEGARRFEELRQQVETLNGKLAKAATIHDDDQVFVRQAEAERDEARQAATGLRDQVRGLEIELESTRTSLGHQKTHLEKQLEREMTGRMELEESSTTTIAALREELAKTKAAAETQLRELGEANSDFEKRLATAEQKANQADPEEIKRLKRRVHHYERLYNAMKGLKEMTEERNHNWEVALKKLSHWIYDQKNQDHDENEPIGKTVSTVLNLIDAQLIEDSEIHSDHHDAIDADDLPKAGAGAHESDPEIEQLRAKLRGPEQEHAAEPAATVNGEPEEQEAKLDSDSEESP